MAAPFPLVALMHLFSYLCQAQCYFIGLNAPLRKIIVMHLSCLKICYSQVSSFKNNCSTCSTCAYTASFNCSGDAHMYHLRPVRKCTNVDLGLTQHARMKRDAQVCILLYGQSGSVLCSYLAPA